jgi:hypothetical protein
VAFPLGFQPTENFWPHAYRHLMPDVAQSHQVGQLVWSSRTPKLLLPQKHGRGNGGRARRFVLAPKRQQPCGGAAVPNSRRRPRRDGRRWAINACRSASPLVPTRSMIQRARICWARRRRRAGIRQARSTKGGEEIPAPGSTSSILLNQEGFAGTRRFHMLVRTSAQSNEPDNIIAYDNVPYRRVLSYASRYPILKLP